MSLNSVNYNPHLHATVKFANNSCSNTVNSNFENFFESEKSVGPEGSVGSEIEQSNENNDINNSLSASELRNEIRETKSKQGLIGKLWNGFKNLTHIGASSNKAEQAITDFENGKISQEEMNNAVKGYQEGQKQCVDMVADIVSGIAAFAAFAFATGVGIAASPFTGGASLGLAAIGLGIAGAAGSGVKIITKGIDAVIGGREYDSFGYDLATGGINGMFAPITAGIGGAVGKAVASRVGVTALKESGEVIVKEALEGTVKGSLTRTLLSTNVKYIGGTMGARAIAMGADMAVNGAISGAVDSSTRYIAGDSEDKSIKGFAKEVGVGTLGGFVMAPALGGGMRLAGNGIGKFTGKLQTKVSRNYAQAKSALMNTPVTENPDMEVLQGFGGVFKQVKELIHTTQAQINTINFSEDNLVQKAVAKIEVASQALDNASNIADNVAVQTKKIPDTNMYKELGTLPERVKAFCSMLKADASTLDKSAQAVREKISSGKMNEGLADFTKYYADLDSFGLKLDGRLTSIQTTAKSSGIEESVEVLSSRLERLTSSADFQNLTREQQVQALMENSNILLSKFAQTFSSDDSLPPDVAKIFKQFTSNCTVSRNQAQAQKLADELYGAGKYTIKKSFGAGTIGETYLAQTADGTDVVIKMLKEGVTPEKFAQDRAMFTRYINEFATDNAEREYKLNLINNMFDAWDKELDFGLEAQGAKSMAENAKRFNVAQTIEVGIKDGQNISLVMEKANGVKLDSLLEMIKVYRENPIEYSARYANEIEKNPALGTPENWINDLGIAYQRAQNEQAMFIGGTGTRTIHADPHPGNVFVDFDVTTGKPKIVYIDTGNVIQRTNAQTLQDIGLSLNMMFGNSKGIADAMLDGATIPTGVNKTEIAEKFAKLLDERLFKAGVNIKSTQYTQNTINAIMKELNVVPNAGNSNLMKATLQRIETSRAIHSVCGTSSNKVIDIKDLAQGILKSFKVNPKETWNTIYPIFKWAYKNKNQASLTFFQMLMKTPEMQNYARMS